MWSVASVNTQILVKVLYGCLHMRHVCGHFPPTYVALYISSERQRHSSISTFPAKLQQAYSNYALLSRSFCYPESKAQQQQKNTKQKRLLKHLLASKSLVFVACDLLSFHAFIHNCCFTDTLFLKL